jgi:hypothetical protein
MNLFSAGDALVGVFAPERVREEICGDFREHYRRVAQSRGAGAGSAGYVRDVLASIVPLATLAVASATPAQWIRALGWGLGARALMFAVLFAASRFGITLEWVHYLPLALVALLFCIVPRRPQLGALTVFLVAFVAICFAETAFSRDRWTLVTLEPYLQFALSSAFLLASALLALGARRFVRR